MSCKRTQGFTLIELLVALLIMALLAIAGYRGLDAVLEARHAVAQETLKWQELMFFFSRMDQDVAQALPRTVRAQDGSTEPAWHGLTAPGPDEAQLSLTRAGVPDENEAQLIPQRIGYRLDNGTISLLVWPALDQANHAQPQHYPLLHNVSTFDLRYLADSGKWYTQWPPLGQNAILPRAMEVDLTLAGGERISRIFALQ
jgi:general secretion pathway protein J